MFDTTLLTSAYKYKEWADARTLQAIEQIRQEQFQATYKFVLQQLNHMLIVEELFRARLENLKQPHDSTNTRQVPPLAELKPRLFESIQFYQRYCAGKGDATAFDKEAIVFEFADGKPGRMTRLEMLFHVLNHGSYHRGAISHALDLGMVAHPVDGYAAYVHAQEPVRRKPSGA